MKAIKLEKNFELVKQKLIKHRHLSIFIIGAILFIAYHSQPAAKSLHEYSEIKLDEESYEPMDGYLQDYDSVITQKVEQSHIVGGALVVVHNGKISLLRCYGVKRAGTEDSIDNHTVFRLASVSKGFAGILAGILADEKAIDLDDKVIKYLPDLSLKDSINTYSLTIRHLLSHTSGLVPHAYDNLVEHNIPISEILSVLKDVDIAGPPGMYYGYQNVMFSLFDTISAISTSSSYSELLHDKIFIPFKMDDASTGFEAFKNCPNKAYPHRGNPARYYERPINKRYYNTLPAAGVNASIMDLAHYMLAIMDKDTNLLNESVKETVFAPQIRSYVCWKYFRKWSDVEAAYYGLGWRVIKCKEKTIVYHGGFVEGYRADIAMCPEYNTGIAFLSNSPSEISSESIPVFWEMFFNTCRTVPN